MNKSIEQVVALTLSNISNYPESVQPHVWGADMARPIDAVVAALKDAGYTDLPQEPEVAGFKRGDRVTVTAQHRFFKGMEGTVIEVVPERDPWPIAVWCANGESEIFDPHELTKNF